MNESYVRTEAGAGVLALTLDRAQKANALTARMMEALGAAFARTDSVVQVLRSTSPRLFCAGADIAEFVAGPDHLAAQERALVRMIERRASSAVPLVAIARGKASGAGAILLALADVVIASEDLEIACPEIRFGMYPIIVEAVLQSRVSPALAARMCMGQGLDAAQAGRAGLVTEILPAEGFGARAEERLGFYMERRHALGIARRSRLQSQPPAQLIQCVHTVAPLMAENFGQAEVRQRIETYLSSLGRRA